MNPRFILIDFIASIKHWTRSIGTVFWTIAFPILLILIFGSIFSGADDVSYEFYVQDFDDSNYSNMLISVFENISVLDPITVNTSENITKFMETHDISAAVVIPQGFQDTIIRSFSDPTATVNITYYFDPSQATTTSVIQSIVMNTINEFNLNLSGGHRVIGITEQTSQSEEFSFIDFFIPGMIGFTIMTSCIYGSIERNTKYRKDGILRKMLTMPVTRTEWILAKMLFMLFLSFISTTVILLFGVFVWGLHIHITFISIIIIIATSFLFSGMGMIIGRFVKDEETADMAGGAITFPMMFLAGTFYPLSQMPAFLQSIAQVLPLYYVNEGLRNTMIYGNLDKTLYNLFFVLVFAIGFFAIGALVTKWKED